MDDGKGVWSEWQSLLSRFREVFTPGGWARFAQWVSGTVLCPEEHTITQILTALGLEEQWRNLEHFAEYGSWDRERVERQLMRVVEQEHPSRWGRHHPVAIDDTKEHRTSAEVWGTCTFHESTARSPNRATTVRFRQEDGFPDHKQRLGKEECRAWTKEPVLRTFQAQMVAQTLLRLMQSRLEAICGNTWYAPPPWNPKKRHVSILDLRRLFWRHRPRFSQVLAALDDLRKPPQTKFHCGRPTARAA